MSRPLRLEFAGALYHVTSRGDRKQMIYRDDTDRYVWLDLLGRTCARFNFAVHSFCVMGNHFHVLVETGDANLSQGMRQLNGQYAQYFNRRHQLVGHLFQGRYTAILVQKESHLRELARYVVLNPVRARMVTTAGDWPWSSYRLMVQSAAPPSWLQTDWLLAQFGIGRDQAVEAYQRFVAAGIGADSPMRQVRHQLFLGDDDFVLRHRCPQPVDTLQEVSRAQRRAQAMTLAEYHARFVARDLAIVQAYLSTAYTMKEIARYFCVSAPTVSRIIRRNEGS